ncbi:MAG: ATP-binding cassette domain-containing protein [Thermodesulfobacteriota bacterium]
MSIIQVRDLVKKYNGKEAVSEVSFDVPAGEIFGFLGPNGAGKTTTIKILCTLLSLTSGSARVSGFDCMKESGKVRSNIGLVFQEVTLDNELTAYENLKFHCYLYNMDRRLSEERISEILEVVGLSDKRGDMVKTFSGGMKRRLEIARGLLHRPKVLFLDEPTLGLDPQTRNHVWDFIKILKEKEGNTVFMTTHYMDEAESCDRIAIIDNGKIITQGSPEELKRSLKGDTIFLSTVDDKRAALEIKERFSLETTVLDSGLSFLVEGGEKFIPELFKGLSIGINSVNLKRPTLDDVFINLTGREIRDVGSSVKSGEKRHERRH